MSDTTSNVEFANKINEAGHHHSQPSAPWGNWVGVAEALLLAIVAIATAWSGYQAAKWDALSAKDYALVAITASSSTRIATRAGQDRLYDITTFNGWIAAKTAGNEKLADLFQRRFRPEYETAFLAWIKLDPLNSSSAVAGPLFMPNYVDHDQQESEGLAVQANHYFQQGVATRETGDEYVKVTVYLATVLLLTALSQRFEIFAPRVAVLLVASGLLVLSTYWMVVLPRL